LRISQDRKFPKYRNSHTRNGQKFAKDRKLTTGWKFAKDRKLAKDQKLVKDRTLGKDRT